jgi:hypothetical protein
MTFAYFGLPEDYLEQYRGNIEKVKAEDVARVAKKYLYPEKLVLLVVGKSEEFDQPVASLGEVAEIDISIPPPPDTRPEVEKTASTVEAGGQLLARMAGKLSNGSGDPVRSAKSSLTMVISLQGQKMSLGQEVSFVLPDKVRQTVKTPMGDQVVVLNGGQGFMQAGGQDRPVPEQAVIEGLASLGRDLLVLASNADNPELEALAAGSDEVEGTSCEIVSVTFMGGESRLCIDADGTVLKQSYRGNHPFRGTPGTLELRFSDYTEFDGRLAPRTTEMSFDGEDLATLTLDAMEINVDLDASLFELPETE